MRYKKWLEEKLGILERVNKRLKHRMSKKNVNTGNCIEAPKSHTSKIFLTSLKMKWKKNYMEMIRAHHFDVKMFLNAA